MSLTIKSTFNLVALTVSAAAFHFAMQFVQNIRPLRMKTSPKALINLQDVFIDPMERMQTFVFAFDLLVALYFVY